MCFLIMIVGGAAQGKLRFAREKLGVTAWSDGAIGTENCLYGLHRAIRAGAEMSSLEEWLAAHPDGVVICDEVGCGVTPLERADRDWRERVGRICCHLTERAEAVYRVCCGRGVRIK